MITIAQTTEELTGAVADLFPEHAFGEWRRNIIILVDPPPNEVQGSNQRSRAILIRLGEHAMNQYRAAQLDSRKKRCAVLRAVVSRCMDAYDFARHIPEFVIDGADAIVD
jgi:hypothetical protein